MKEVNMNKLLIGLLAFGSISVFASTNHMVTGPAAQEMYEMLDGLTPNGEIGIRAVELNEKWTATSHGTRLFSPNSNMSCTKSVKRDEKSAVIDFYYCDSYETPEKIDWDSPMVEGISIYKN